MDYLENYLKVRRMNWPYEGRYCVEQFRENGFVAKIDDSLAGLVWVDDIAYKEARMKMNLKPEYAEYGIGTELLEIMVEHLKKQEYQKIYYSIKAEHYAYQIYAHLEFKTISAGEEMIHFVWEKD